ncbi:MAG: hypothetical protein Q9227_009524, partial [Pyrenula ochraceoflavens]
MAEIAQQRLDDPQDQEMDRIFQLIYKRNRGPDSPAYQYLRGECLIQASKTLELELTYEPKDFTQSVPNWIESTALENSNYRFYCDNDPQDINGRSRWTLRPDPTHSTPRNYMLNALRPRLPQPPNFMWYQEWWDLWNGIHMGKTRGCQEPGVMAETYFMSWATPGHRNPKASVTRQNPRGHLNSLASFDDVASMVILHEVLGDEGIAYGWRRMMELDEVQATLNADSHAFFCLLANLADYGWRLDRRIYQAREGVLVYDPTLRRRPQQQPHPKREFDLHVMESESTCINETT